MTWEVFTIVGTIAFTVSGAVVAMEERYDLFGVLVLAMVTAFGGGAIRDLLIGIPVSNIWQQGYLFDVALVVTAVMMIMPNRWIDPWRRWVVVFDAVGLSAFAIQGALFAVQMKFPLSGVVVAAVMTGIGGGLIRDLLAGRKPLVLHDEIYAAWAVLAGVTLGLHWIQPNHAWQLYGLLIALFTLRMLSVVFKWRFPRRSLRFVDDDETKHFWY